MIINMWTTQDLGQALHKPFNAVQSHINVCKTWLSYALNTPSTDIPVGYLRSAFRLEIPWTQLSRKYQILLTLITMLLVVSKSQGGFREETISSYEHFMAFSPYLE